MRNTEFKPIVGMVGIGNRLNREQNMDYQIVVNRVRNLDVELIDGGDILAEFGKTLQAAYRVSKTGVQVFAETAAIELAPYGIRVNTVSPGLIDSPDWASKLRYF